MAVKYAKLISAKDNVATCVADIRKGECVTIRFEGQVIEHQAVSDIPFGHKMALVDIPKGGSIVKYGVIIGQASQPVGKGEWVHCHNCLDTYEVQ